MRRMTLLVSLLTAALVAGCASAPTQKTSKIAGYGVQLMQSIHTTQKTVADLEATNVISTQAAGKFFIVTYKIGDYGQQLADALALYDAATTKTEPAARVGALLAVLDTELQKLTAMSFGPTAQDQVVKLVQETTKLVRAIRLSIPQLSAPPSA